MTDEPRRLTPVVMFDDKDRESDPNVRDFRPIAEYVEEKRGKSKVSDSPEDDPRAATSDEPDDKGDHDDHVHFDPAIAPPVVDEPEAPPEPEDQEGEPDPPTTAPEPHTEPEDDGGEVETPGETPIETIPSPWDEDI